MTRTSVISLQKLFVIFSAVIALTASRSDAQSARYIDTDGTAKVQSFSSGKPVWYTFEANEGSTYTIETLDREASDTEDRADTQLILYASDKKTGLQSSPSGSAGGFGSILTWTSDSDTKVYIKVSSATKHYHADAKFEIKVTESEKAAGTPKISMGPITRGPRGGSSSAGASISAGVHYYSSQNFISAIFGQSNSEFSSLHYEISSPSGERISGDIAAWENKDHPAPFPKFQRQYQGGWTAIVPLSGLSESGDYVAKFTLRNSAGARVSCTANFVVP